MSLPRAEPFLVALHTLRERLRDGAVDYERRLAATEIADELRLSPTPVREALARLAGEGLLEDRRGQGYFVRRPSAADVADLYRLSLAHLQIALDAPDYGLAEAGDAAAGYADADPVVRTEQLFDGWVAASGGRALLQAHRRVQARLGPVRRREGLLIADLADEAEALAALWASGDRSGRLDGLRAFHRRRVRLADRLADLLERRSAREL